MILKAQAAFTSVTDEKTKAVRLDGGLEITGEIVPDTPLQHEMLVALLDKKSEPSREVSFDVEAVTEKITFKVRFKHKKDVVAAANARLKDRQDADNLGLPLHIHLENKAAKAKPKSAPKAARKRVKKANPDVPAAPVKAAKNAAKK